MKQGHRRIYYDILSGNKLAEVAFNGFFTPTSISDDIDSITLLSERNKETFDVIELGYGQYAQDFAESNGYRVNPETKTLEFSYPDPNESEPIEPVYIAPLSEQVEELKVRQDATENALLDMLMNF